MFAPAVQHFRGLRTDHAQFREIESNIVHAIQNCASDIETELVRNGAATRTVAIMQTMGRDFAPSPLPRVFWRHMERNLRTVFFGRERGRVRLFGHPFDNAQNDRALLFVDVVISLSGGSGSGSGSGGRRRHGKEDKEDEEDQDEDEDKEQDALAKTDPASLDAICSLLYRSVVSVFQPPKKNSALMLLQYAGVLLVLWVFVTEERVDAAVQWLLARLFRVWDGGSAF